MNDTLARSLAQRLHRTTQSGLGGGGIAGQRLGNVLDRAMHLSLDRAVARMALKALAMALDR